MYVLPTVLGASVATSRNMKTCRLDKIINVLEKRTFGGGGNIHGVNIRFQEIKKFRKALKLSGELG